VRYVFDNPPPRSRLPKTSNPRSVTEMKANEVARQLTLLDAENFTQIKPKELFEKQWTGSDKHEKSPNIIKICTFFNELVMKWVTEALMEQGSKKREAVLSKLLYVAYHCKELNNFSGVQAVLAVFGCAPINRLPQAKRKMESQIYRDLHSLMSPAANFQAYRTALREANPPLVPYLGQYLTDLTFIDDANKITCSNGHIHFRKCYLVADVIQELMRHQQAPYNLTCVPAIRQYLLDTQKNLTEDQAYEVSLKICPRGKHVTSISQDKSK